jgi:malonyl-CoA O-methyltransferase
MQRDRGCAKRATQVAHSGCAGQAPHTAQRLGGAASQGCSRAGRIESIYWPVPAMASSERPPTIDPVAAARWERSAPAASPWLHEEVGRRMAERLQWIKRQPQAWADWEPVRGGLEAHALVAQQYPQARAYVVEPQPVRAAVARERFAKPWWRRLGGAGAVEVGAVPAGGVQMLWSNMELHMSADPQALMRQWHEALAVDGFLMFSCLGPDTLQELRALYAALGWPPPCHEFTDMHDWGDMLVHGGFAEPVMDMERITLAFDTPERLLQELRELGINLHPDRFAALRGRGWQQRLSAALDGELRDAAGQLTLTFEIIYGHAMKPLPRAPVGGESAVSLADMRTLLHADRRGKP